MNLILLFQNDFVEGTNRVCLKDRRHKHVVEILKAKVGDKLCVGMLNDRIGQGSVIYLDNKRLEMVVHLTEKPPGALPVTLILALPRPIMLKRILFSASSLGVKKIFIINAQKVEKSFWHSRLFLEENMTQPLVLGLEQSRDTVIPVVQLRLKFKPFVEDELPALIEGTLPLAAHPQGTQEMPRRVTSPVTLAIGPEGGFTEYEIEKFRRVGFSIVHLGRRILRVETVLGILLGRLF